MLRCAIVSTLVQIVKALGTVSAELNPFLLPVIQLGTDVNQSAIVYLLEDTLELWLTVLENSTTMTNELMQLFTSMPALLGKFLIVKKSVEFKQIFNLTLQYKFYSEHVNVIL